MPAKYSHVKKRSAAAAPGALKKSPNGKNNSHRSSPTPTPHADRGISQAMTAVSQLERAIARLLLLRYEQDIARLFSTRLYSIALVHLPTFVMRCAALAGPGWVAFNADADEIKDFFRAAISMDMRQAGERVATKSVLWSYTALRHFAQSNDIAICTTRGLHSMRLLPHYAALKAHLDTLEALPAATFAKPPHLGGLTEGQTALEDACALKYASKSRTSEWGPDSNWRTKVRIGYEKLAQTLWRVAREFDVRGYGLVLREKLTGKWCDCGCSTDHLGEVCERTVREDQAGNGVRVGKTREWDGRGSGVYGWETEEEEDVWEIGLDFGGWEGGAVGGGTAEGEDWNGGEGVESEMTIGELMEWRYIKAEREKEQGNVAFRKGDYVKAVKHYEAAYQIEPELPHYQLNLAAAHLKLSNWMEAEAACSKALMQHRSGKGYFRRAKARKMLGRNDEAIRDLRAILKLQPTNTEALQELLALVPPPPPSPTSASTPLASSASTTSLSSPAEPSPSPSSSTAPVPSNSHSRENSHAHHPTDPLDQERERLGVAKPKQPKPLPFARTRADDRKLKIVVVPAPAPGAGDGHGHACACQHHGHGHGHANGNGHGHTHSPNGRSHSHGHSHSHSNGGHTCDGHHGHGHHHHAHAHIQGHGGMGAGKGKGKGTGTAAGLGIAAATRREKEQALEAEMLKVLEAMRLNAGAGPEGGLSVMLPSWDRYVVRKAEA
ncbi:hypothetical protein K438DRAFT_1910135 [Mycena galopus ATCC 62051]|nr:hypothetical protein K438DRAFT_1910135 [Mycena galopus ATCC 62051]